MLGIFLRAVIFGVGVELGREIYKTVKSRAKDRLVPEDGPAPDVPKAEKPAEPEPEASTQEEPAEEEPPAEADEPEEESDESSEEEDTDD